MSSRKIILDTNLWISFLITKNFIELDKLIEDKKITLIFSQELLEEFVDVVSRPKFKKYFSKRDIDKIFQSEDRENYINILNAGNINLKEFRNLLNGNLLENKLNKQKSIVNINFESYSNFFTNFSEKVNSLDDEKKILLEKYLKKIEELWK